MAMVQEITEMSPKVTSQPSHSPLRGTAPHRNCPTCPDPCSSHGLGHVTLIVSVDQRTCFSLHQPSRGGSCRVTPHGAHGHGGHPATRERHSQAKPGLREGGSPLEELPA